MFRISCSEFRVRFINYSVILSLFFVLLSNILRYSYLLSYILRFDLAPSPRERAGVRSGDVRSGELSSCFMTIQQSPETGDC